MLKSILAFLLLRDAHTAARLAMTLVDTLTIEQSDLLREYLIQHQHKAVIANKMKAVE